MRNSYEILDILENNKSNRKSTLTLVKVYRSGFSMYGYLQNVKINVSNAKRNIPNVSSSIKEILIFLPFFNQKIYIINMYSRIMIIFMHFIGCSDSCSTVNTIHTILFYKNILHKYSPHSSYTSSSRLLSAIII